MISDGFDDVAFKVNGDQMSRVNSGLKPHQLGNDKNRAGSMAMWVAPIRVYNHLSRENHICFLNLCFDAVPFRETVADPNRR